MIAPAASQLGEEFGISNTVLLAMSVSTFVLGYGTLAHLPLHATGTLTLFFSAVLNIEQHSDL